jgi:hypothetical protein
MRRSGWLSRNSSIICIFSPKSYSQVRGYALALLETFYFGAAPDVAPLLAAIDTLRAMIAGTRAKVPDDAPTGFLRSRWKRYVLTEAGCGSRVLRTGRVPSLATKTA